MAVPYSNTKLRVPKGFQNVLEGLAREVLRCQPENIYGFAAAYFEELLRKRQETGYDDITLLGAKLEDRFYNNHSFKNPNINTNNEEQQSAAVKIQSEYRRFAAKKDVDSRKEEEAAVVIQASVRGHLERQSHKSSSNNESNATQITHDELHTTTEVEHIEDRPIAQEVNQNSQENSLENTEIRRESHVSIKEEHNQIIHDESHVSITETEEHQVTVVKHVEETVIKDEHQVKEEHENRESDVINEEERGIIEEVHHENLITADESHVTIEEENQEVTVVAHVEELVIKEEHEVKEEREVIGEEHHEEHELHETETSQEAIEITDDNEDNQVETAVVDEPKSEETTRREPTEEEK